MSYQEGKNDFVPCRAEMKKKDYGKCNRLSDTNFIFLTSTVLVVIVQ